MSTITLESFETITQFARPRYLIKPLLEMGSVAMLFGPTGSGKSFVALDLAFSCATGMDWGGMATRGGPVVYITAEGGRAFGRRVMARYRYALTHSDAAVHGLIEERLQDNLHIVRMPVQIGEPAVRDALVAAIREKIHESQTIGLIVVDTLARCAISFEENSNDDMTRYVDACVDVKSRLCSTGWIDVDREDGLVAEFDQDEMHEPVILLVHHTGHTQFGDTSGKVRERGASSLRAALDVVIGVDPGAPAALVFHKMKDGEEPLPMAVEWDDTLIVGYDDDGVEMRGRVAVVGEPGSARSADELRREAKNTEWSDLEQGIMRLMEERPDCSMAELAVDLDVSKATIGRRVAALKQSGRIIRVGNEYRVVSASQSPFLV